ncbi:MAG: sigma-70 family RNA polymerase sigma factor [Bordetella sp.]|nr:sigma-70 family RNA polymerase sigma factor [Bordetella sp.]
MTTSIPSQEMLMPLWRRWRGTRDEAARDALISHHLPYARMLAATLYGKRTHDDIEFDDYFQMASMGLIESVERFDPDQGVQFRTFASKRVLGAVINGLARMTEKGQQIGVMARLRRERLQDLKAGGQEQGRAPGVDARDPGRLFSYLADVGIGVALGILLEDSGMYSSGEDSPAPVASPEVSYFRKSEVLTLQQLLRNRVQRLPEAERRVIQLHYQQEMSFEDVALRMGVTRGRISQLHRKGLTMLRALLQDEGARDVMA